ncbi:uncharacterized protein LOC115232911 [Formica exsecta]|uniref:uncharacterized protein LOC115232911 n=1 Tax=Formica exsecta TaxID=72781 RepID=UPI001143B547|nr:uncharacterized protein LOC115232911 [Formica exsecta]
MSLLSRLILQNYNLQKHAIVVSALCYLVIAEPPVQAVKPNVIGSSEQHTSFSFIRPGLTQTSFAFNGPSSHQSFASSISNPQLAQKVLPSLAHAFAYRNPGLGYYPFGSIANGAVPQQQIFAASATGPLAYQTVTDPATALAYMQQLQQPQQSYLHAYQPNTVYQLQLAQLLALRQAQLAQAQQGQLHNSNCTQVPEQIQLQRQEQQPERQQNLLGIAYSSSPSVAHVKVSGNGYKFNF